MIHDLNTDNLAGAHNLDFKKAAERIAKSNMYRDLSVCWVTPTINHYLDDQVVFQSWDQVVKPMNQKFMKLCIANAEVADAYNAAVELILKDGRFKYMLTVETDNLPPADGLMRLFESIDRFDIVAGLYWMKGEGGTPHIYGNPEEPGTWSPQVPLENTVQPCNMVAMGFTLFNMDVFRKVEKPWFKTSGADAEREFTQDGYFFQKAHDSGANLRVACDTRVRVGHIDFKTRQIW